MINQAVRPRMGKGTPFWSCRYRWLPEATSGKAEWAEEVGVVEVDVDDDPPSHPSKPQTIRLRIRVTPRGMLRTTSSDFIDLPLERIYSG